MKTILILILSVSCIAANAQLSSLVLRGDTLFNFDPLTGAYTQLTRTVPPQAGQTGKAITTSGTAYTWGTIPEILGYTPYNATNPTGYITAAALVPYILTADAAAAYQPLNANLTTFAGLTPTTNNFIVAVASAWASRTPAQVKATLALDNVTNESKATMFTNATFTGVLTIPAGTSFTTPVIGAATGTSFAATGAITSTGTGGIGYAAGAGGTVTQLTSKSTGVTLNKISGQITMVNSALAAAAEVSFTLTNSTIAANDVVVVSIKSGATSAAYFVTVGATAAGSCNITLGNTSAGSLSEAVVLNFAVIKAAAN
jgi:hypothetical protein